MKLFIITISLLLGCATIETELAQLTPSIEGRTSGARLMGDSWYLYQHPIVESTRYIPHPELTSYLASKVYSGSFIETESEYLLFAVADNNQSSTNSYHFDQIFLKFKSKTDGLPFEQGWQWYQNSGGEPIPVLAFGVPDALGTSIQNWLGNPTVMADGSLVAYYSVNVGNIAARYSMGKAVSTDNGRTWTRYATNVTAQSGGENHYQFQQALWDADLGKWIILSPNGGSGTQGRWTSMRVYHSTDGITGQNFTKVSDDIYDNTQVDVGGFGFTSKPWKVNDSTYQFFAAAGELPDYKARPELDNTTSYKYMSKLIVLVSGNLAVANPSLTIEEVVYETDQQAVTAVMPTSQVIDHGGKKYIFISTFEWKLEAGAQFSVDVRLLCNEPITTKVVGNDCYPDYAHRFYKLHQTQLDDSYLSTSISPKEIINNDSIGISGAPTQYNFNRVYTANGYVGAESFTHDQQYLGFKGCADLVIQPTPNNITRGLVEKKNTFKIISYQSKQLEVWIYGTNGGIKKYRTSVTYNPPHTGLFKFNYWQYGFTATLNAAGTDIDLKLFIDYTECAVTKVQDNVFTTITQNNEPITFGRVEGLPNQNKSIGSCIVMSGAGNVTKQNWIESELF